jgi:hypothetical protein
VAVKPPPTPSTTKTLVNLVISTLGRNLIVVVGQ